MGADRYQRHIGRRMVCVAALTAMSWLAWSLPASAQASSPPPEAQVEPAAVTVTGVQLKGEVNPDGLPTTYYFEYSSQTCNEHKGSNCDTKTAVTGPLTGGGQQEVAVQVTGLEAGRYSYELVAHNADGTSEWHGSEIQFTVGAPTAPLIESESVSHVTSTHATLEAVINPAGLIQQDGLPSGADYQFQVVRNTSEYPPELVCSEGGVAQPAGHPCGGEFKLGMGPDVIPLGGEIDGGSKGQQVSLGLAGAGVSLEPGTTYHYRVLGARALTEEEGGIFWERSLIGPDQTFTTPEHVAPPGGGGTTSPVSGAGQSLGPSSRNEPVGLGGSSSSSTPGVKSHRKTKTKRRVLTNSQKLAKALKMCKKKPKGKRARCKQQARRKYRTARSNTRKG
jgi:hypothetical protein